MIGIFDSGIGGLTVLKALQDRFPGQSFLYLGDTARLPYGTKSAQTIRNYVEQNIRFLLNEGVQLIVVACNSASTVLKKDEDFDIPVYGVIRPGAKRALDLSQSKRIGIMGTRATIAAQAYSTSLTELDLSVKTFSQACPLLVPLVEEGWMDDPITNLILYRYLQPLLEAGVDTLILGCTHYPTLRAAIHKVMGNNVHLVDSATAIADSISVDLEQGRFQANDGPTRLCVTDNAPHFQRVAEMILEQKVDMLELVNV